ncbi:Copper Transporter integral membrane protein that functions in high affinity copper transport [Myotisia sp. PD_48]|nr:Copper Transporter integral membrane protein that functions in high affinity copper transport [Myotisia sp. PD_48]
MDHSHMSMTSSASMPAATGGMAMDHGGGGHGSGNACKISMLWNWNVINSCFISSSWRITSKGMFAGSCIGVVLLVMSLEFLRRLGHEYDKYALGQPSLFDSVLSSKHSSIQHPHDDDSENNQGVAKAGSGSGSDTMGCVSTAPCARKPRRPNLLQHFFRSLLHMVQFGVAYFIMLLAMYYNGYFIICILIGAFLGSFVFQWKSREEK